MTYLCPFGGPFYRPGNREESPDRTEHRTAESADRRKLMGVVTEKNRRASGKGENGRQELPRMYGDIHTVHTCGLQGHIYRQLRAARPCRGVGCIR